MSTIVLLIAYMLVWLSSSFIEKQLCRAKATEWPLTQFFPQLIIVSIVVQVCRQKRNCFVNKSERKEKPTKNQKSRPIADFSAGNIRHLYICCGGNTKHIWTGFCHKRKIETRKIRTSLAKGPHWLCSLSRRLPFNVDDKENKTRRDFFFGWKVLKTQKKCLVDNWLLWQSKRETDNGFSFHSWFIAVFMIMSQNYQMKQVDNCSDY